jgi:hypothetical protein
MCNSQMRRSDSGGAAGQAGANYQSRVAAWYGVRMLAGSTVGPLHGLTANVRFTTVYCQTESPVDDIVVSTSERGYLFIQAKNRVTTVSIAPGSEFAEVITQFVRQYLFMRQNVGSADWRRPLDPKKDRLVLTIGSASTSTLTRTLRELLDRFRETPDMSNLNDAVRNQRERATATTIVNHARQAWEGETGVVPSDDELIPIFKAMRIHVIDVGEEERDAQDACDLLRGQVLHDRDQAEAAWSVLVDIASQQHERRSGFTGASLSKKLRQRNFALLSPPDFREAIEILRQTSSEHLDEARRFSELIPGVPETTIQRDAINALTQAVEDGHLLVIGEPGAGKTGSLYPLACQLANQGASVVFLSVQYLTATTPRDLSSALSLEDNQDLTDVLANWFETERGYIIFDALDAARSEPTRLLLRRKMSEIMRLESRWTVIASIIALLVWIDEGESIVGDSGGPWAAFADSLSEQIGQRSILSLRTLVWKLTDKGCEFCRFICGVLVGKYGLAY